jgi:hypothetical protein
LPVDPDNPGACVKAVRITEIKEDHVIGNEEPIGVLDLPYSVIHGAGIYHNRDGSFFAGGAIS